MPSVAKVLKEQMVRIARGQVLSHTAKLRRNDAALKRQIAGLQQQIRLVERELRGARGPGSGATASGPLEPDLDGWKPTGRGIRSMRGRLGLSQESLAKLLNITSQSVYLWERKGGRLRLRSSTFNGLSEIRALRRKDAQARLRAMIAAEAGLKKKQK
jgi:hypothetical protein